MAPFSGHVVEIERGAEEPRFATGTNRNNMITAERAASVCLGARYSLDWRSIPTCEFDLRRALSTSANVAGIAAFHALLLPIPCAAQFAIISNQASFIAEEALQNQPSPPPAAPLPTFLPLFNRRIRVAVLRGSANSNVERLAALLSLDTSRFSVRLFSTALDAHSLSSLTESAAHTSLRGLSDVVAARLLSGFDAILDASGHTAGNRLGALALRPAPVAASVLGFPGSYGGGRLVDYLTTDRVVMAPHACSRCAAKLERLSMLPHTYQVSPAAVSASVGASGRGNRGDVEITSGRRASSLLLASFTRAVRWHPESLGLWSHILLRTSTAVSASTALWLLADSDDERFKARAELASSGISSARILFSEFQPDKAAHLKRHAHLAGETSLVRPSSQDPSCHLAARTGPHAQGSGMGPLRHWRAAQPLTGALFEISPRLRSSACVDTTPLYGSHTTAADALGAGAPLLTLPADAWASRVGMSVALSIGAPEMVAYSSRGLVDFTAALLVRMERSTRRGSNEGNSNPSPGKRLKGLWHGSWTRRAIGLDPKSAAHSQRYRL